MKQEPLPILFIINNAHHVSHTTHLLRLIPSLPNDQFIPFVYILSPKGELIGEFKKYTHIYYGKQSLIRNIKILTSIIHVNHIKLVCTKELRSEYLMFILKYIFHQPICHITIRPSFGFPNTNIWNLLKNIFFFFSCYLVDYNIGVADHVAMSIKKYPHISQTHTFAIPNSIPIKKLKKNQNTIPVIITTGRLAPEKGIWKLLTALKHIHVPYHCFILGKGTEEQPIRTYIAHNELQKKIEIIGFKKNCYPYLQKADIFISLSTIEGLPLALLEAMNAGCTCIVSNIPGHTPPIMNNKNGLVINETTLIETTKILSTALKNNLLRKKLGEAAHATIRTYYSDVIVFSKYHILFKKLGKR